MSSNEMRRLMDLMESAISIKESKFEPHDFMVAKEFLPAIINDDYSGLDNHEVVILDNFLSKNPLFQKEGHFAYDSEQDDSTNFRKCDICGFMADCRKLTWMQKIDGDNVEEAGGLTVNALGGSSNSLADRIQNESETTIECLPEDMPIEGNVMASGDDEADKRAEDEVRSELEHNPWAWCCVKVTSTWNGLESSEYLGGCSYKSEEDFVENSGYYQDMRSTTLADIKQKAEKIIKDKNS